MISPARIVPGADAAVGRFCGRSQYFSLRFRSFMVAVIGSRALKARAAALFSNLAVNAAEPVWVRRRVRPGIRRRSRRAGIRRAVVRIAGRQCG